jgi:hypothetical protein
MKEMIRVRDEGEDTGAGGVIGEATAEQALQQSLDNLTQSGFDEVPDLGSPDGMKDLPFYSPYRYHLLVLSAPLHHPHNPSPLLSFLSQDPLGGDWGTELRGIAWIPVLTAVPRGSSSYLPWPERYLTAITA